MTKNCLIFTNLTNGNIAQEEIWYNKIMATASNDHQLIGDGVNSYYLSDLQAMTKAQVILLRKYSVRVLIDEETLEGTYVINKDKGGLGCFSSVKERANDLGTYWFVKDDAIMTNVVNYTEETFDPAWQPVEE